MANEYQNRVTVMAKSNFQPEPNRSYSGDIFGILISLFLIIGGLSGRMVLRGTESSPALVVVGCLFLVWDIVSIFRKRSAIEKADAERYARSSKLYDLENAVKRDERALEARIPVHVKFDKRLAALDFGARMNGRGMTRDVKALEYSDATGRVHNLLTFNNLDLTVVFDVDPYASEVVIDFFRDKTGFGIALPDNVTLVATDEQ